MKNYIVGMDLASEPDKTAYTEKKILQDKIYKVYGLSREQVENSENTEALERFKKINNINDYKMR
ncbi:MAG: hypothetical protein AB6733_12225 [Clostridiaceae bacterium]